MRLYLTVLLIFISMTAFGQTVMEMNPVLGVLIDKSPEKEIEFIENKKKCEDILKKNNNVCQYSNGNKRCIYRICRIPKQINQRTDYVSQRYLWILH